MMTHMLYREMITYTYIQMNDDAHTRTVHRNDHTHYEYLGMKAEMCTVQC